jgi:sugar lactone lactonase YvrE
MAVRKILIAALVTATAAVLTAPATATAHDGQAEFPTEFPLPDGFQPEGIAIHRYLPLAYFGSRVDGDIYRVNLATGEGRVLAEGPGTPSVGLKIDGHGRLFVSGGNAGDARVIDAHSGRLLASYQFATGTVFINDVVLTPAGPYFTDSQNPALYHLPLGRHGGLPDDFVRVPLTGDWAQVTGFNANGIARTPDGRALLVIQSATGFLFRVDPATGVATRVDLGAETLANGDGLLLSGRTLYAVQNRLNLVAVVKLNWAGTAGVVEQRVGDPRFDVPTTVAKYGNRLYLPNARFNTPPEPTTPYNVVAIPKP